MGQSASPRQPRRLRQWRAFARSLLQQTVRRIPAAPGGRGSSFWANRKTAAARGRRRNPLAGVAIAVTYSVIRKSRARSEVMSVVNAWAETLRMRDLDNNLRLYAERVSPFFLRE